MKRSNMSCVMRWYDVVISVPSSSRRDFVFPVWSWAREARESGRSWRGRSVVVFSDREVDLSDRLCDLSDRLLSDRPWDLSDTGAGDSVRCAEIDDVDWSMV